jgi:hypothetical protein
MRIHQVSEHQAYESIDLDSTIKNNLIENIHTMMEMPKKKYR